MARRFHNRHRQSPGIGAAALASWKTSAAMAFGVALLAAGYLVQTGAVTSKSYQIRLLQQNISDLKDQEEKLQIKVAAGSSVQAVEQKVQEMGMVPTTDVQYLDASPSVVAKR